MSVAEIFIKKLQERLDAVDRSKRTLLVVIQYDILKNGVADTSIVLDLNELKVYEGTSDKANVTVKIEEDDFKKVAGKQATFTQLLESGKVTATGDVSILKQLDVKME